MVKDTIVTGVSGGEYGIRGFVDGYDPASGKRLWRFYTIPGPSAATPPDNQGVAAIDPETSKIQWRYGLTRNSLSAGVFRRRAVQLRAAGIRAKGCTARKIWT